MSDGAVPLYRLDFANLTTSLSRSEQRQHVLEVFVCAVVTTPTVTMLLPYNSGRTMQPQAWHQGRSSVSTI